jgi:hypothetical protein
MMVDVDCGGIAVGVLVGGASVCVDVGVKVVEFVGPHATRIVAAKTYATAARSASCDEGL